MDDLIEQLKTDPKVAAKIEALGSLEHIDTHPGWLKLKEHIENGTEHFGRVLAKRLLAGEEVPQREIDYYRGAIEIAKAIFAYPEVALANLERTAAAAYAAHVQQEAEALFHESPYTLDGGET